ELFIPVAGDQPLREASFTANKPSWLNAAKTDDGMAVRVWGTPPSNGWGTYTPTLTVKDHNYNIIGYELNIRVGNCKNKLWYADADGDGYGADESQLTACWQPTGYVQQGGDCNDADPTVNPANGQENCDTAKENAAPVITMQGYDPDKKYYAAGQEYVFTVQVTDPNAGDHLMLKAEYMDYYEPGELTFSPSNIIRGTGTVEMEVRWTPNTERPEYLTIDFIATDAAGATTKKSLFADPYVLTEIHIPEEPIVIGIDQHFQFELDFTWDPEETPYAFFHAPEWAADDYYHNEALILGSGERNPGQADVGTYRIPVGVSYPWGTTMDTVTVIVSADCTNRNWRTDADGDGYGSGSAWSRSQITCSSWPGMAPSSDDCNDQDASINPASEEIPGDGIDNNCNGEIDEGYGVSFAYYHGNWSVLPDFSTLEPVKTGNVESFTIKPSTREDYFGFVFSGYIKVETAGTYTFYTKSDDGSKLYIDGQQVVDNDGLHGLRERSGTVYLNAGQHPIEVHYFERTGFYTQGLEVRWAGPGIGKQLIPSTVLTPATWQPNMAPIADAGDNITVHESQGSVTLINNSSDPDGYIAAYFWKSISLPTPTMVDPTARHLVVKNLRPGDYSFELEVTDNWGVTSTDRVRLFVTSDGSNARVASVEEEEEVAGLPERLTFYPNPVQDKLTIETGMLHEESLEVLVYDLRGSLVYKGRHQANPADGTLELNLYELKQGIYMLRLQTHEQQRTIKIIK
ncbi:MAG: T9SS type A sorting domain-containing protein, partial [Bacteroidetes bacterium]|nr:T9SS type A sorting domain-containing protein [Bacteroidota bacterium]